MARTFRPKRIEDENEVVKDVHAEAPTSNRFRNYARQTETFNDMGLTNQRLSRSRIQRQSLQSGQRVDGEERNITIKREESMFQHLFKMLIGQSLLPDFDEYAGKKLSYGQKKKIAKWEEYFKKIQNMTYYGVMNNEGDRRLRYMEYDRMEWMTPEVGRALDVLAADSTIKNEENNVITIVSENEKLKEELEILFYDILDLNSQAFWMVRDMIKYGDSFWTNHIDTKNGFRKILPAPVEQCEREVGYDETNPLAYRFRIAGLGTDYLMPYEVSHFRLRSSVDFGEYGKSVLENGRRIWRQLITIEDSMLIYRLVRAPERRIFYFDVGNLGPNEVENAVNRFAATMKKDRIFSDNGEIDYRMGLNPIHKDSLIPLLDNRILTIEQLSKETEEGKQNWVYSIDDKTHEPKPGKVVWCGKNFSNAEILKIELDDNSYILSHPTHPFILRDGTQLSAKDLVSGQSLMPFYSKINKKGYEEIYNASTNRKINTHTFVAKDVHKNDFKLLNEKHDIENKRDTTIIVHHKDVSLKENKLHNEPDNLIPMLWKDHVTMHSEMSSNNLATLKSYYQNCGDEHKQKISMGVKKWQLLNPEAFEKMKLISKYNLIHYNRSEKHRLSTIECNKKYDKARKMGEKYNHSDLHKQHDKLKSEKMKNYWINSGHRIPKIEFNDSIFIKLIDAVNILNIQTQNQAIAYFNEHLISDLIESNKNNKKLLNKRYISKNCFKRVLNNFGYENWKEFKSSVVVNHKIKSISVWNENSDVYCMSVFGPNGENDRHNFAVLPFDMQNTKKWNRYSGVYIKNSIDEDIIIPTRGEKSSTKIETLPSTQWSAIDDVKYILQKFITALGVPNAYLGYEEALNSKATLGNEDIRYAKYVERIQASFLETLYDIALIHLYIRGFKTVDLKSFELHLSNPSHINELQELEIIQARLDLYINAKEAGAFSTYYLYKNILRLSDDEIEEEENLKLRDGIYQFCITNSQQGVFLTVKDVLDYNKKEAKAVQAAGDELGGGMGGGGFGGDMGGTGLPGESPEELGSEMGGGGDENLGGMSPEQVSNQTGLDVPEEISSPDLEKEE